MENIDVIKEAYWVISVLADGGDVYKMELVMLKNKLGEILESEDSDDSIMV